LEKITELVNENLLSKLSRRILITAATVQDGSPWSIDCGTVTIHEQLSKPSV
jgi:hypothetical protein